MTGFDRSAAVLKPHVLSGSSLGVVSADNAVKSSDLALC